MIASLQEQVNWFRIQTGLPTGMVGPLSQEPDVADLNLELPAAETEEEAEIHWLHDNGFLDEDDRDEALAKIARDVQAAAQL